MRLTKKLTLWLVLMSTLTAGSSCTAPKVTGPSDKTWLSPGKIQIRNLSPGSSARQKIIIHNGSSAAKGFSVYYRVPDYVEDGFAAAPTDARGWVRIDGEPPVLAPNETREIEIILDLPGDARPPERWEFWIGIREKSQDTLAAELCCRWLVTMRD